MVLYKMLKERMFSLETLYISENSINEEGINIMLKGKTDFEGIMLFRGLLVNKMRDKH